MSFFHVSFAIFGREKGKSTRLCSTRLLHGSRVVFTRGGLYVVVEVGEVVLDMFGVVGEVVPASATVFTHVRSLLFAKADVGV